MPSEKLSDHLMEKFIQAELDNLDENDLDTDDDLEEDGNTSCEEVVEFDKSMSKYLSLIQTHHAEAEKQVGEAKFIIAAIENINFKCDDLLEKKLREELDFIYEDRVMAIRDEVLLDIEKGEQRQRELNDAGIFIDNIEVVIEELQEVEENAEAELQRLYHAQRLAEAEEKLMAEEQRKRDRKFDELVRSNHESKKKEVGELRLRLEQQPDVLPGNSPCIFDLGDKQINIFEQDMKEKLDIISHDVNTEKERLISFKDEMAQRNNEKANKAALLIQKNFRRFRVLKLYADDLKKMKERLTAKQKEKVYKMIEYQKLLNVNQQKKEKERSQKKEHLEKESKDRMNAYEAQKIIVSQEQYSKTKSMSSKLNSCNNQIITSNPVEQINKNSIPLNSILCTHNPAEAILHLNSNVEVPTIGSIQGSVSKCDSENEELTGSSSLFTSTETDKEVKSENDKIATLITANDYCNTKVKSGENYKLLSNVTKVIHETQEKEINFDSLIKDNLQPNSNENVEISENQHDNMKYKLPTGSEIKDFNKENLESLEYSSISNLNVESSKYFLQEETVLNNVESFVCNEGASIETNDTKIIGRGSKGNRMGIVTLDNGSQESIETQIMLEKCFDGSSSLTFETTTLIRENRGNESIHLMAYSDETELTDAGMKYVIQDDDYISTGCAVSSSNEELRYSSSSIIQNYILGDMYAEQNQNTKHNSLVKEIMPTTTCIEGSNNSLEKSMEPQHPISKYDDSLLQSLLRSEEISSSCMEFVTEVEDNNTHHDLIEDMELQQSFEPLPKSLDIQVISAVKIQSAYRGYKVRKTYRQLIHKDPSYDQSDDSDYDYDPVNLNEFEFRDSINVWQMPRTPLLSSNMTPLPGIKRVLSGEKPRNKVKEAWRPLVDQSPGKSLTEDIHSMNRYPPIAPSTNKSSVQEVSCSVSRSESNCESDAAGTYSEISKKAESISNEWGFQNEATAELMLKRAKKLGKGKRRQPVNSQERYQLFQKTASTSNVCTSHKNISGRKTYPQSFISPLPPDQRPSTDEHREMTYTWVCNQPVFHSDRAEELLSCNAGYFAETQSPKTSRISLDRCSSEPIVLPQLHPTVLAGRQLSLVQAEVHNPKTRNKKPSSAIDNPNKCSMDGDKKSRSAPISDKRINHHLVAENGTGKKWKRCAYR